jgi:hypothetical protein
MYRRMFHIKGLNIRKIRLKCIYTTPIHPFGRRRLAEGEHSLIYPFTQILINNIFNAPPKKSNFLTFHFVKRKICINLHHF